MDPSKATLRAEDGAYAFIQAWCRWRYELAVDGPDEHRLRSLVADARHRLGPDACHEAWADLQQAIHGHDRARWPRA